MAGKTVFICALFFLKNVLAQCYLPQAGLVDNIGLLEPRIPSALATLPLGLSLPAPSFTVESDGLLINGAVNVVGTLPFTGAVVLEGVVPTAGVGGVRFNTGVCDVGIIRELPY